MKKTYKVPLFWTMMGVVEVEAESEAEAINIALASETPLPEGSYVIGSAEVDSDSPVWRV